MLKIKMFLVGKFMELGWFLRVSGGMDINGVFR